MAKHSRFYINAIWQYGLQIVKYIFPLITIPYLTRVLEPDGYAVYAYILAFMSFVQVVVEFGFNLLGTKLVVAAKNNNELGRILGSITLARLLLCLVSAVGTIIACVFIPIMKENIAYCMLSHIAVCGRALAPDFLFQGKERMSPITTRYFVSKGISTLLTFAVVRSFDDILWIPILDVLASIIALTWSFAAARKMFGVSLIRVPLLDVMRNLRESALYFVSNMSSVVFTGFATLLIGFVVVDQSQISFWSLAITAISAVQSLYSPITNSLYPRMVVSGDFAFAKKLSLFAGPVVLAGTVCFALLANPIMLLLGGPTYLQGSYILVFLSPVLFFGFFGMLYGWPVLGAAGKVKELTSATMISASFSVASLLLLACIGEASITLIAIIRVATEMLMCGLRLRACIKLQEELRETRSVKDNPAR